ncbi:MAG: hypothetical protein H6634_17170 [Anaerolineales bacterium]|nr:hypothetical protein [Anaerolineales bacterium]MCB9112977.1 hypothetical protein [Anaerolineales bacterium]
MAIGVQQTSMAIQQATLDASNGSAATLPPPPDATYTPYPTYTPETSSGGAADAPPQASQADINSKIKASNILIYEDAVGDPSLVPVVGSTINSMNFSGGRIINTGDALGKFRDNANSATNWDLMIVAAEVRTSFSGEMFEMMYDHIDNGGAVIIEVWYIDKVINGKIAPILSNCGVTLFRDWRRDNTYDPYNYSIYWLDKNHPLLSTPSIVSPPSYPYPVWFGDAGDLLELSAGGDATLVGGLFPNRNTDYGVLAVCMGGRMVIQTFSSHDYKWDVVQPLWRNYITYTLTNHYEYGQ